MATQQRFSGTPSAPDSVNAPKPPHARTSRDSRQSLEMTAPAGAHDAMRYVILPSSLGAVLVARSEATGGLSAVLLDDDRAVLVAELRRRFPGMAVEVDEADPTLAALARGVVALVEAPADPAATVDAPLDARGTDFQQLVWRTLRGVPAGTTVTYAELARRVGRPEAVRAVASACAANPLAIVVPCHRVVRSDGGLSGYRWGVQRKRALLEREAAAAGVRAPEAATRTQATGTR